MLRRSLAPLQRAALIKQQQRAFTVHRPLANDTRRSALISQKTAKEWKDLTTPQKVVAATKTSANIGLIVAGVAVTGTILYYVGSELFGTQSSTHIFSDALERVRQHEELSAMLGSPIKGHGEPSRSRMRRNRRILHQLAQDSEGREHLLMRFYVEGPDNEGTCMVNMIKDDSGKWTYRQLYVDVPGQGLPSRRIYVEGSADSFAPYRVPSHEFVRVGHQ
ncbi:mitochondrial import inner membrane translocase subunit tim21 [Umbelopsis nana]